MTVFLPQWTTLLLRAAQRRELRHRMGSRSLIIGDVPWVSQCAEAFLSKLFACTFNATAINVWAANPEDHLVHRFTHRVVRGALVGGLGGGSGDGSGVDSGWLPSEPPSGRSSPSRPSAP